MVQKEAELQWLCLLGSQNWDFILTPECESEYMSEWRGVEGLSSPIHKPPVELHLASRREKAVVTRQGLCGTRTKLQPTVPLSGSAMLEKSLNLSQHNFLRLQNGHNSEHLYRLYYVLVTSLNTLFIAIHMILIRTEASSFSSYR